MSEPTYTADELQAVYMGLVDAMCRLTQRYEGSARIMVELETFALYLGIQMADLGPATVDLLTQTLTARIKRAVQLQGAKRDFDAAGKPLGARGAQ